MVLLAFLFLFSAHCFAQPQLRNTRSFDTGDSLYYWSARVGARMVQDSVFDDTTTGYHVMSTCTFSTDLVGDSVIRSVRIGSDDTLNVFTDTCRNYGRDARGFRFYIYAENEAGIDQFTLHDGVGMQRIPQGYETSIRLGCMVNSVKGVKVDSLDQPIETPHTYGSQSLFYTMRVTNDNALLILNFAIVARRYDHSAYDAGEFLVRVVRRDSTGEWANEPINDSLWYKVSAPHITGDLAEPWRAGSSNDSWPCDYVYKPWNKCAVNLSKYIGEDVRMEIYSSNCIWGVDPLYAYIAGDYTSPSLISTGCSKGSSPAIDTLRAPAGLPGYEWFVSSEGPQADLYDYAHLDTVNFRRITGVSSNHIYCPSITDFVLTPGDTLSDQTFMCIMHSALDPAKPFTSKLYANVHNSKPIAACTYTDSCDRSVTFTSTSRPPRGHEIDTSATFWVIFNDLEGNEPLDTLYGEQVRYRFDTLRAYLVEEHVFIADADTISEPCEGGRRFFVTPSGPSVVPIRLSAHDLCVGDSLVARARLNARTREQLDIGRLTLRWTVDGQRLDQLATPYRLSGDTLLTLFNLGDGMHHIVLNTDNGRCTHDTIDSACVYLYPRIIIDPPSGNLCLGDTLRLSAFRDDINNDTALFIWSSTPPDPDLDPQQGSPYLFLSPTENTTYTLHTSPTSTCQLFDLSADIKVFDYPVPAMSYSPHILDLANPLVNL